MSRSVIVATMAGAMLAAAGCQPKDPTAATVALADAKLTIDQPDGVHHVLALAADGNVQWDGAPLAKVSRGGRVTRGKEELITVDKHGNVSVHRRGTNLIVDRDGTFDDGDLKLTIDRDGAVGGNLIAEMDLPSVAVEGSKVVYSGPPEARQALLLGFACLVIPDLAPARPMPRPATGAPLPPAPAA
ncbi:MAG TPA: hypothetical protein VHE35_18665, partial [Kofleriaceae bacterium]|nr:hypothetical protein [Kofleriaceae bacterium]